jgi:hypothetical protein
MALTAALKAAHAAVDDAPASHAAAEMLVNNLRKSGIDLLILRKLTLQIGCGVDKNDLLKNRLAFLSGKKRHPIRKKTIFRIDGVILTFDDPSLDCRTSFRIPSPSLGTLQTSWGPSRFSGKNGGSLSNYQRRLRLPNNGPDTEA